VTIAPFIEWSKLPVWQRPLSIRLAIQATAPTGQYSPNDPVNAGSDAWQVSPYLAFTLSRLHVACVRPMGDQRPEYLRLERQVRPSAGFARRGQHPGRRSIRTERVRVGGHYGPLAAWRGRLRNLATRRHASGWSGCSEVTPTSDRRRPRSAWSDGHATVIANVYEEVEARNHPRGTSAVLRFLYPL
jgi:hypothetical protein